MFRGRRLLREWLDRSRMSQKELAERLGVSDAYLSQMLTGYRRGKLETLVRVEEVTGVPVGSWADKVLSDADEITEAPPIGPDLQRVK